VFGELLGAFETHSVTEIRAVLDSGLDVRAPLRGKPPVQWLTEMYLQSERFPECLRLLLDRGAVLEDPRIASVLLDDADALAGAIRKDRSLLEHRTSLVSAFTPLLGASLLHVAAEYGNLRAARVLLEMGADIEARAAVDAWGFDGHTPLFHTVNSILDHARPVMDLLLRAGARTDVRLPGITWGRGFEWETTCFDVTPVSYAQLGLLPQMHRRELDVYANVKRLLEGADRRIPPLPNVPNRYLQPRKER